MPIARQKRGPAQWPAWRHGPNGEAAIFNSEAEVPYGWTRKPNQQFVPTEMQVLNKEDLTKELNSLGVSISPTWGKAHMKKILDGVKQ